MIRKMLESVFIVLLFAAIIFMILVFKWESLSIGILDVILWFILSAGVHSIEIPYQYITSGDVVGTGVQEIQSLYPLSLLFIGIGIIVFLYWLTGIALPMLQQKFGRMM